MHEPGLPEHAGERVRKAARQGRLADPVRADDGDTETGRPQHASAEPAAGEDQQWSQQAGVQTAARHAAPERRQFLLTDRATAKRFTHAVANLAELACEV